MTYYGLTDYENSMKKAYYYFKLAQTYGNRDSLYYLGLMETFQLDGTFNALQNLKLYEPQHFNMTKTDLDNLHVYINDKRFSHSLNDIYFASMQGNVEATISLGYKHFQGIGVPQNCSTAALYYDQICNKLFLEDEFIPQITHKKRLDHDLYNIQQGIFDIYYDDDKLEIIENVDLEHYQRQDFQEMFTLGYYYYYGLGGLKRNYEKSFEIMYKLYTQESHHVQINKLLGEMYMNGLGTEQNYQEARKLLNEVLIKSNSTLALNELGFIYLNGLGVKQDRKKGIDFFKKAAEKGDADGQYNYGLLLMMPDSEELKRNFQLGQKYIIQASDQGHAKAQYSLALIYLDGVDFIQNCDLAVQLLRSAASKGPWADHLKNGDFFFKKHKYRASFLNFIQSAMMGEEIGYLNTGILADKFQILNDDDIDFENLEQSLEKDNFYQILKQNKLFRYNNLMYFLFDDYLKLIKYIEPINSRYEILNKIIEAPQNTNRTINKYLAFKSFSLTYQDFPYSSLRLGDYYYYGWYDKQSYETARSFYAHATQFSKNDTYSAQGYYNLGYMNLFGEGGKKDLQKSELFFNKSVEYNPTLIQYKTLFDYIIQKQLWWETFEYSQLYNIPGYFKSILFAEKYKKSLQVVMIVGLSNMIVVLYLIKKRFQHKRDLYLKFGDQHEHFQQEYSFNQQQQNVQQQNIQDQEHDDGMVYAE